MAFGQLAKTFQSIFQTDASQGPPIGGHVDANQGFPKVVSMAGVIALTGKLVPT